MSKTLIFSDVHLKVHDADKARHQAFVQFLRSFPADEYDRFICLGDLFDFWYEYKEVIFSGYFDVLRAFADLHEQGVELHLICGNHDFWAGRFLKEIGFQVHPDTAELPFGDLRGHFCHGDGINPKDTSYRIYKRIARNPLVMWAFRQIHPDWAMRIAQGVSHGSRTFLGQDNPAEGPEARALNAYARDVLGRGEADVVFCGHAHAPAWQEHPTPGGTGLYINSGDWLAHRSYVIWDGERFSQHLIHVFVAVEASPGALRLQPHGGAQLYQHLRVS